MKNNVNLSKKYKEKEEEKLDKFMVFSVVLELASNILDLLSCF